MEEKRKENRIVSESLPDEIKQVTIKNLSNQKNLNAKVANLSTVGIGLELQIFEEENIELPKKGDELELSFNELNFRCLGLCMYTKKIENKTLLGVLISNPLYQNKYKQLLLEKKII